MTFKDLNLNENLQKGIDDAGFVDCMPVQERTFEHSLQGIDVIVQSQTGSGKTAAFLITIFQRLANTPPDDRRMALIIVPTRELAVQIEREAKLLGGHMDFSIGSIYGGVGYRPQEKLLQEGADMVIGTPGRLIDLNQSRKLDFRQVGTLVIDEADRLFDMGFLPDLRKMLKRMPRPSERHTMLYSATIDTQVRHIGWEYMHDAVEITINPERITVDEISQELYHVSKGEKINLLLGLLRRENPQSAIVFTNTKRAAEVISKRLSMNGYTNEFIIGDLAQKKRIQVIDQLKSGKLQILVATDVAARGLHIDDLSLVVNYDLPEDPEGYVHRIGRTARVGKAGKAISLACERYVYGLSSIEDFIGMKIPVVWPDDELFHKDESEGVHIRTGRPERRPERGRSGRGRDRDSRSRSGSRGPSSRSGDKRRPAATDQARSDGSGLGAAQGTANTEAGTQPRDTSGKQSGGAQQKSRSRSRKKRSGSREGERTPAERAESRSGGSNAESRRPSSDASMNERLRYYREKYGEDFKVTDGPEAGGAKSGNEPAKRRGGSDQSKAGTSGAGTRGKETAGSGGGQRSGGSPRGGDGGGRNNGKGANAASARRDAGSGRSGAQARPEQSESANRENGGVLKKLFGFLKKKD